MDTHEEDEVEQTEDVFGDSRSTISHHFELLVMCECVLNALKNEMIKRPEMPEIMTSSSDESCNYNREIHVVKFVRIILIDSSFLIRIPLGNFWSSLWNG